MGETNKVVTAKAKEGFLEACLAAGKRVDEKPHLLSKGSDGGASLAKKKKKKIDEVGDADSDDEGGAVNKKLKYVIKGRSAIDPLCKTLIKEHHVLEEGDVIYSVMLNLTDIAYGTKGSNKFYVLQLIEHDKKPIYHVYNRWGRVGVVGQRKLNEFNSKAEAKDFFHKKFKEKTGNNFEDRDNYDKHRPSKYNVVEIDYGDEVVEDDTAKSKPSKLKEKIPKKKHKEESGEPIWSSDSEPDDSEHTPDNSESEPELKHKKPTKNTEGKDKKPSKKEPVSSGSETEKEDEETLGVTKYFPKGKQKNAYLENSTQHSDSALHPKVQEFIQLISDVKMMKRELMKMDVDLKKMPLGKLNKKQIKKGYEVLKEINEILKAGGNQSSLIQLSNTFYTLIPHDIGFQKLPVIDKPLLKQKLQMLETLADIEIATSLLEEQDGDDDPITARYNSLKAQIRPLDSSSDKKIYTTITQYVENTHGPTHDEYVLEVLDIFVVAREGEGERFNPLPNRHLLWHGSRLSNFMGIISQGLRIAPPEAPVTGYMFGKGVYFADMASKSANYCNPSPTNNVGLLILSEVALGDPYDMYKAQYFDKPPSGYHSVRGVGKWAPDPKDFHTMNDGVIVPMGKPIDNPDVANKHTALNYNEFIVYDVAQVKIRYILKIKFNYKSAASTSTTTTTTTTTTTSAKPAKASKGKWQFKSGNGWKDYDSALNKDIQKNKKSGVTTFTISINNQKYTIDLDDSVQYPVTDPSKTRQIRYVK